MVEAQQLASHAYLLAVGSRGIHGIIYRERILKQADKALAELAALDQDEVKKYAEDYEKKCGVKLDTYTARASAGF